MAKKKRKKRSTSAASRSTSYASKGGNLKALGMQTLGIVAGLAAGTLANKYLGRTDVNGQTITGMDGETSSYVTPAILSAAGIIGATNVKGSFMKNACIGLAASGGASIVNQLTKRSLVALNGDDEYTPLPGVGSYDYAALPDNNELMTNYNPELQPVGGFGAAGEYVDANGDTWQYVDDGSDAAAQVNGIEEVTINY